MEPDDGLLEALFQLPDGASTVGTFSPGEQPPTVGQVHDPHDGGQEVRETNHQPPRPPTGTSGKRWRRWALFKTKQASESPSDTVLNEQVALRRAKAESKPRWRRGGINILFFYSAGSRASAPASTTTATTIVEPAEQPPQQQQHADDDETASVPLTSTPPAHQEEAILTPASLATPNDHTTREEATITVGFEDDGDNDSNAGPVVGIVEQAHGYIPATVIVAYLGKVVLVQCLIRCFMARRRVGHRRRDVARARRERLAQQLANLMAFEDEVGVERCLQMALHCMENDKRGNVQAFIQSLLHLVQHQKQQPPLVIEDKQECAAGSTDLDSSSSSSFVVKPAAMTRVEIVEVDEDEDDGRDLDFVTRTYSSGIPQEEVPVTAAGDVQDAAEVGPAFSSVPSLGPSTGSIHMPFAVSGAVMAETSSSEAHMTLVATRRFNSKASPCVPVMDDRQQQQQQAKMTIQPNDVLPHAVLAALPSPASQQQQAEVQPEDESLPPVVSVPFPTPPPPPGFAAVPQPAPSEVVVPAVSQPPPPGLVPSRPKTGKDDDDDDQPVFKGLRVVDAPRKQLPPAANKVVVVLDFTDAEVALMQDVPARVVSPYLLSDGRQIDEALVWSANNESASFFLQACYENHVSPVLSRLARPIAEDDDDQFREVLRHMSTDLVLPNLAWILNDMDRAKARVPGLCLQCHEATKTLATAHSMALHSKTVIDAVFSLQMLPGLTATNLQEIALQLFPPPSAYVALEASPGSSPVEMEREHHVSCYNALNNRAVDQAAAINKAFYEQLATPSLWTDTHVHYLRAVREEEALARGDGQGLLKAGEAELISRIIELMDCHLVGPDTWADLVSDEAQANLQLSDLSVGMFVSRWHQIKATLCPSENEEDDNHAKIVEYLVGRNDVDGIRAYWDQHVAKVAYLEDLCKQLRTRLAWAFSDLVWQEVQLNAVSKLLAQVDGQLPVVGLAAPYLALGMAAMTDNPSARFKQIAPLLHPDKYNLTRLRVTTKDPTLTVERANAMREAATLKIQHLSNCVEALDDPLTIVAINDAHHRTYLAGLYQLMHLEEEVGE